MPRQAKPSPSPLPSEKLRAVIRARGLTAYRVMQLAALGRPDSVQRFLNGAELRTGTFDRVCEALGLELVEREEPQP